MTPKEELELILKLIKKYNLPLSPILEYAINEEKEKHTEEKTFKTNNLTKNKPIIEQSSNTIKQQTSLIAEDTSITFNDGSDIILTHLLDWSSFNVGFTVEKQFHPAIFKALGKHIPRRESVQIKIEFQEKTFYARFTNSNRQAYNGDTIQLFYNGKSDCSLSSFLKRNYSTIYNYLRMFKEKNGGRKQCFLPPELRKMLVLRRTNYRNIFKLTIEQHQ